VGLIVVAAMRALLLARALRVFAGGPVGADKIGRAAPNGVLTTAYLLMVVGTAALFVVQLLRALAASGHALGRRDRAWFLAALLVPIVNALRVWGALRRLPVGTAQRSYERACGVWLALALLVTFRYTHVVTVGGHLSEVTYTAVAARAAVVAALAVCTLYLTAAWPPDASSTGARPAPVNGGTRAE
jgi:hypothetical protein